jgi:hypothetical protein
LEFDPHYVYFSKSQCLPEGKFPYLTSKIFGSYNKEKYMLVNDSKHYLDINRLSNQIFFLNNIVNNISNSNDASNANMNYYNIPYFLEKSTFSSSYLLYNNSNNSFFNNYYDNNSDCSFHSNSLKNNNSSSESHLFLSNSSSCFPVIPLPFFLNHSFSSLFFTEKLLIDFIHPFTNFRPFALLQHKFAESREMGDVFFLLFFFFF